MDNRSLVDQAITVTSHAVSVDSGFDQYKIAIHAELEHKYSPQLPRNSTITPGPVSIASRFIKAIKKSPELHRVITDRQAEITSRAHRMSTVHKECKLYYEDYRYSYLTISEPTTESLPPFASLEIEVNQALDCAVLCACLILGRERRLRGYHPSTPTRMHEIDMAHTSRWPGSIQSLRDRRDMKPLTRMIPDIRTVSEIFVGSLRPTPEQLIETLEQEQARQSSPPCPCLEANERLRLLTSANQAPANWTSVPRMNTTQRRSFDKIAQFGRTSGDIIISANNSQKFLSIEPAAVLESIQSAAISMAHEKDEMAIARWHEKEVWTAVRKTFQGVSKVIFRNSDWTSQTIADESEIGPGQIEIQGEFDTAVLADGILFDFQAKAPRSDQPRRRSKLVLDEALKQHARLRDALDPGITVLSRSGTKIRPLMQLSLHKNVRKHICISVGLERPVMNPIGQNSQVNRVVTTVDHLRLVNEIVPAPFRLVYWIYRASAEAGQLRFIDEVEFLNLWWLRFCEIDQSIKVVERQVLATESVIEAAIVYENTIWSARENSRSTSLAKRISGPHSLRSVKQLSPLISAKYVTPLCREVSESGAPGWTDVLCAITLISKNDLNINIELHSTSRRNRNGGSMTWKQFKSSELTVAIITLPPGARPEEIHANLPDSHIKVINPNRLWTTSYGPERPVTTDSFWVNQLMPANESSQFGSLQGKDSRTPARD